MQRRLQWHSRGPSCLPPVMVELPPEVAHRTHAFFGSVWTAAVLVKFLR